jgi:HEPN domain-containing protein
MENKAEQISEMEQYLLRIKKNFNADLDTISLPKLIKDKNVYKQMLQNIDGNSYIQRGDLHYFVARILLINSVYEYGYFAGQQCVENYLKGYLRDILKRPPKQTHDLTDLLIEAKTITSDLNSFLHSDYIEVIVGKFNPFYEFARYPVQISKPANGQYVMNSIFEVRMLDYFIHRIREVIKPPSGSWDILSDEGHYHLTLCKEMHRDFYQMFFQDNINFCDE